MLELKGDFVNYTPGIKTSSLPRGLVGNLKMSSIQARTISNIYILEKCQDKVIQKRASVHFSHSKFRGTTGTKYAGQQMVPIGQVWPACCHLKHLVIGKTIQLLITCAKTKNGQPDSYDFPDHLHLSFRLDIYLPNQLVSFMALAEDYLQSTAKWHPQCEQFILLGLEERSAKCENLYCSFLLPPIRQH